jgi:hypothetical protein
MSKELRFNIKNTTPKTLPMARLADYLKKLATVLGSEDHAHFIKMEPGSARALIEVDEEAEPIIISRAKNAAIGQGPKEAVQSFISLRDDLEQDGLVAELEQDQGEVIAKFVSPVQPENEEVFGPVWQDGSVDGLVTRIEGEDQTIHATLIFEGSRYLIECNREVGMQLGPFFQRMVRVFGKQKMWRTARGKWEMEKIVAQSAEGIEDTSLLDTVARLRAIPDNDLNTLKDPIGEMLKIRRGET